MKKSNELFKNSVIVCAIGIIVAGSIIICKLRKRVQELIEENAKWKFADKEEKVQCETVEAHVEDTDYEIRQREYEEREEEYKRAVFDMQKQITELESQVGDMKSLNNQAGMAIDNAISQEQLTKEFAEKMNRIIVTLQNIASQTKLLSLNASIEAARIGDNGREFADVAEKIRMLAANSINSATEVEELLRELICELEDNIVRMQKFNETLEFDKRH